MEKETAAHSSILAWKIPWTAEPVGYHLWGRKQSDTTERIHFTSLSFSNTFPKSFYASIWSKSIRKILAQYRDPWSYISKRRLFLLTHPSIHRRFLFCQDTNPCHVKGNILVIKPAQAQQDIVHKNRALLRWRHYNDPK